MKEYIYYSALGEVEQDVHLAFSSDLSCGKGIIEM